MACTIESGAVFDVRVPGADPRSYAKAGSLRVTCAGSVGSTHEGLSRRGCPRGRLWREYYAILRRPVLTWGATESEATSRLPGDELLKDASGMSTHAIDIDAPASAVWPWLAQMGPSPRGGAYTYDWIENLLGLNMHSVDRVLPEFQHPDVGKKMSLGSRFMRVERVESERVLAWRSEDGNWVWTFVLSEHDGRTRLISRNRFRLHSRRAHRHGADGAWLARDGAQDASRHQGAS